MEIDASPLQPKECACRHYRPATLSWFAQTGETLPCPPTYDAPCSTMAAQTEDGPNNMSYFDVDMANVDMEMADLHDQLMEEHIDCVFEGINQANRWLQ
jgi:hypothetical protein